MGTKGNSYKTTGDGVGAAARRVLLVLALALLAVLVGVVLGATVLPRPGFLEGVLPTIELPGLGTDTYAAWDDADAPEYYRVIGTSHIDWSLEPGETEYGALDTLGRATFARACVTEDLIDEGMARDRGDLRELEPSGWGRNAEVDIPLATGEVYHGYLWNRSHLLAKSLGGSDNLNNLITGTRTQNVGSGASGRDAGGMSYCEWLARDWVFDNPGGWVYYSATPVYEGDEPICRSVLVDMRSSDGSLDVRIEVYNTAQGIAIDYATGESKQAKSAPRETVITAGVDVDPVAAASPDARDYVVNLNSERFHLPDCEGADQIADHNRQDVHTTRDDLIAQGYEPCGSCQP